MIMKYVFSGPALDNVLRENRIRIARGDLVVVPFDGAEDTKDVKAEDSKTVKAEDSKTTEVEDSKTVKAEDSKTVKAKK